MTLTQAVLPAPLSLTTSPSGALLFIFILWQDGVEWEARFLTAFSDARMTWGPSYRLGVTGGTEGWMQAVIVAFVFAVFLCHFPFQFLLCHSHNSMVPAKKPRQYHQTNWILLLPKPASHVFRASVVDLYCSPNSSERFGLLDHLTVGHLCSACLAASAPGVLSQVRRKKIICHFPFSWQIFKSIFLFKLPTSVNSVTHSHFAFYRFLSFKFLLLGEVVFGGREDRM